MLRRSPICPDLRPGQIGTVCGPRRTRGWFSENRPDDPVSDRDSRVRTSAALKTGTRFQRTRSDGAVCRQTGAVTAGSGFPRTGCFGTSITALRQCTRIEPSPPMTAKSACTPFCGPNAETSVSPMPYRAMPLTGPIRRLSGLSPGRVPVALPDLASGAVGDEYINRQIIYLCCRRISGPGD